MAAWANMSVGMLLTRPIFEADLAIERRNLSRSNFPLAPKYWQTSHDL